MHRKGADVSLERSRDVGREGTETGGRAPHVDEGLGVVETLGAVGVERQGAGITPHGWGVGGRSLLMFFKKCKKT